ncbi:DUF7673 family protein [Ideonella sp. YS5]|uniref:DUF7673 family protein n=1 Tax=Ideonella sp. YS5 TaxID=3453714 RepID=UPI003EEE5296
MALTDSNPVTSGLPKRDFQVTVQIPEERLHAFDLLLEEFRTGTSRFDAQAQQAQLQESDERHEGVKALQSLFEFATSNRCGSSRVIAEILASLYNGYRFRVDLTDLRLLDSQRFSEVLKVLRLDHVPQQEVHSYFRNGGARFETMFKDYGLMNYAAGRKESHENAEHDE